VTFKTVQSAVTSYMIALRLTLPLNGGYSWSFLCDAACKSGDCWNGQPPHVMRMTNCCFMRVSLLNKLNSLMYSFLTRRD